MEEGEGLIKDQIEFIKLIRHHAPCSDCGGDGTEYPAIFEDSEDICSACSGFGVNAVAVSAFQQLIEKELKTQFDEIFQDPDLDWSTFNNGKEERHECFWDNRALMRLLYDDCVFINARKYVCIDGDIKPETLVIFANCSDSFSWAIADAERIPRKELKNLYNMHIESPKYGVVKWCAIQRNERPLPYLETRMRKEGIWTDEMDKLQENKYTSSRQINKY